MTVSEIVQFLRGKVEGVKKISSGYQFKCPAHDDKEPSATFYPKEDGVALVCHTGCPTEKICAALGIHKSDLLAKSSHGPGARVVARYLFHDEKGKLLYEHQRKVKPDGKKYFLYCRDDGTGCKLWTLYSGWFELQGKSWKRIDGANSPNTKPKDSARWFDESRRVLYRLPQLKKAAAGSLVIYNEGEKDVENAERLGFLATTSGGSSDWRREFAEDLSGFDLVIIPDNDEAGRRHASQVARDCRGKAARVRVLDLPDLVEKGDLSDWIQSGGTREQLLELIETAKEYEPPQATKAVEDYQPIATDMAREDRLWLLPSSASKGLDRKKINFYKRT